MTITDPNASPAAADSSKWLGYGLCAAGVVVGFSVAVVPDGPTRTVLTILALLLPVALFVVIMLAPEVYEIRHLRYPQPSLNLVLIAPSAVLLVVTLYTQVVHEEIRWLGALAGACLALLAGVWAPKRPAVASPMVLLLVLFLYGGLYGGGAPMLADVRFDASTGQVFTATIEGKSMSFGRHGSVYYGLRLAPWGPVTKSATAWGVDSATYYTAQTGGVVCVNLHPGALGIAWYKVLHC